MASQSAWRNPIRVKKLTSSSANPRRCSPFAGEGGVLAGSTDQKADCDPGSPKIQVKMSSKKGMKKICPYLAGK